MLLRLIFSLVVSVLWWFYNCAFSLWRPDYWVGWVWVVKECNSYQCQKTNKMVGVDILYDLVFFLYNFCCNWNLNRVFYLECIFKILLKDKIQSFVFLVALSFALQVVRKKVFAPWCCSCLWLYFYMGWRPWSWAFQCGEVSIFFFYPFSDILSDAICNIFLLLIGQSGILS